MFKIYVFPLSDIWNLFHYVILIFIPSSLIKPIVGPLLYALLVFNLMKGKQPKCYDE